MLSSRWPGMRGPGGHLIGHPGARTSEGTTFPVERAFLIPKRRLCPPETLGSSSPRGRAWPQTPFADQWADRVLCVFHGKRPIRSTTQAAGTARE